MEGVPVTDPDTPPVYDPAEHADEPELVVALRMFCGCGAMHQQVDPVRHVHGPIQTWRSVHVGGGHGPVDAAAAVEERDTRRWAALRAEGRQSEHEDRPAPDGAAGFDWTAGVTA